MVAEGLRTNLEYFIVCGVASTYRSLEESKYEIHRLTGVPS